LQGDDLRSSGDDDDIDLEPHELPGDLAGAIAASLPPAPLDRDGAALDPAKLMQPLLVSGNPLALRRGRSRAKLPDCGQLAGLLRARRERPRSCAAEQLDELSSPHSITSSAVICMIVGTVRPSALAVLRLITSSNLVA